MQFDKYFRNYCLLWNHISLELSHHSRVLKVTFRIKYWHILSIIQNTFLLRKILKIKKKSQIYKIQRARFTFKLRLLASRRFVLILIALAVHDLRPFNQSRRGEPAAPCIAVNTTCPDTSRTESCARRSSISRRLHDPWSPIVRWKTKVHGRIQFSGSARSSDLSGSRAGSTSVESQRRRKLALDWDGAVLERLMRCCKEDIYKKCVHGWPLLARPYL